MKKLFLILFIFSTTIFSQKILTLEESLSIALKESYSIKSAELNLINSQRTLEAIKLGLMTSVNLELDVPRFSRSLSSQFNPLTGAEEFFEVGFTTFESRLFFTQPIVFTNGTFSLVGSIWQREQLTASSGTSRDFYSNLGLRLRQPLFTFNTQKANLNRAEINLQRSERNYTRAERELIYDVTSSFFTLFQAKKSLEIANEKVNLTNRSYETAQNKFKAGLIAEVEALQLEVDLSAAKNELLNAQRRFDEAKDNFKLLIGMPLEELIDISAELEYSPIEVDVEDAVSLALKNRPELLNSSDEILLGQMTVDETSSRGNINAVLTANYGINKTDDRLRDVFHGFAEDRSVILTINVPLWNWGRTTREVEAAEANLRLLELNYRNQKQQIEKEIIAIVNKIESAKARVEVLSKTVELAEKSYGISVARFQAGNITSFDLTQMQLRLTDAKTNSLNALIDYKLAVADLNRKTYYNFERN